MFNELKDTYTSNLKIGRRAPEGARAFIQPSFISFVYYESTKREQQRRLIYEYRCDERLKTKNEESTRLVYTGLVVELENLKTKTRLKDEKFTSVEGYPLLFIINRGSER